MKLAICLMLLPFCLANAVAQENDDRPALGFSFIFVDDAMYNKVKEARIDDFPSKMPKRTGLLVMSVSPNGPAANAKMRSTDFITEINKEKITSQEQFLKLVAALPVNEECKLTGYSIIGPRGKRKYKRGSIKISPITHRDCVANSMNSVRDKVEDTTTWRHPEAVRVPRGGSTLELMVLEHGGSARLFMTNQRRGQDWLFFDSITFSFPSENVKIDFDRSTENTHNLTWEWETIEVKDGPAKKIVELINGGQKPTIRYHGNTYKEDREMRDEEIARVKLVLDFFRMRGGKL